MIFKEDLISIFGERPWKTKEEKIAEEAEIKIKLPNSDIFESNDVKIDNDVENTPVDVAPETESTSEEKVDSKDEKSVDF